MRHQQPTTMARQTGLDVDHRTLTLIYLNKHIDSYWRTRREDWFIVLLPVGYSLLSITLVIFHIYNI